MNLKDFIRSIPDYPKKGILFRDITKSGAVSTRVPSRSNKTNFVLRLFGIH